MTNSTTLLMSRETAVKSINALKEKPRQQMFTVNFIRKSDGVLRNMTCMVGVEAYVTGAGLKFDPVEKGIITVYECRADYAPCGKDRYRSFLIANLVDLKINGKNYNIIDGLTEEEIAAHNAPILQTLAIKEEQKNLKKLQKMMNEEEVEEEQAA